MKGKLLEGRLELAKYLVEFPSRKPVGTEFVVLVRPLVQLRDAGICMGHDGLDMSAVRVFTFIFIIPSATRRTLFNYNIPS